MYVYTYVCMYTHFYGLYTGFCFSHTLFTPTCSTAMSLRITDNKKNVQSADSSKAVSSTGSDSCMCFFPF